MAKKRGRPPKKNPNWAEDRTINAIQRLRAFEEFEASVPLKSLREDLKRGLTADEIYAKYERLAAARVTAIALTEENAATALAAAKDMRDRRSGKPTEKKEVTHRLGNLSDEEIDAYVLTKLRDQNLLTGEETDSESDQED